MNCVHCNKPIPQERLDAIPDATTCVSCLKATGDVPRKKGRLVFDHKTGGQIEVLSPNQFETMRDLPNVISERVSRL
jgi:Prokaryotic dksA/traR C4-type zinc finger